MTNCICCQMISCTVEQELPCILWLLCHNIDLKKGRGNVLLKKEMTLNVVFLKIGIWFEI